MGLIDVDDVVGLGINKAEDKLSGKAKEEKTTFLGGLLRFIVSTIWFVVAFVATIIAFLITCFGEFRDKFLGDEDGKMVFAGGIAVLILFFLITMLIPYLRKKGSMTRLLGIGALGDAIWWIYLYFTM